MIKFKFLPQQNDIGKDLEVNQVSLELGTRETRVVVMHWKGDCKNALSQENQTIISFSRKLPANLLDFDKIDWHSIVNNPTASIISRKAKIELKLEHKIPIFVDEYYAIKITIENKEENAIDNLM